MHVKKLMSRDTGLGQTTEPEPEFLAPLDNLTVTQGRDVSFTCVVNNLGQYKVSMVDNWYKISPSATFPKKVENFLCIN